MVRYIVTIRTNERQKDNIIKKSLRLLRAQDVADYYFHNEDTEPNGVTFQTHRYDYIYLKLMRLYKRVNLDFNFWIYELYDGTQCSSEISFEELLRTDKNINKFYERKGLI